MNNNKHKLILLFFVASVVYAQGPPPGRPEGPPPTGRPPLERALGGPTGRWWDDPEMARKVGLSADQQKKMDDILQQNRLKLIDLNASLRREEAVLEPLVRTGQLDDSRILPQIDRVAQARAELEKANGRLLIGLRHVLTADQWQKLQAEDAGRRPPRREPDDEGTPGRHPRE
jgi:protein CpxP